MEYLAHSLLARPISRFLNEQSFSYHLGELLNLDRFHDDFVRLQNDRFHRAFHVGEAPSRIECRMAEITVKPSAALGMCKSVMRTSKLAVEMHFRASGTPPTATTSNPFGFERSSHHVQYNLIVIHPENSMDCLSFG